MFWDVGRGISQVEERLQIDSTRLGDDFTRTITLEPVNHDAVIADEQAQLPDGLRPQLHDRFGGLDPRHHGANEIERCDRRRLCHWFQLDDLAAIVDVQRCVEFLVLQARRNSKAAQRCEPSFAAGASNGQRVNGF